MTPMIAGSVCGGLMAIAWIIGFGIYFRKRYMRKLRNRGKLPPRDEKKSKEKPEETIVIPQDPAILIGHRPGERYVGGELQPTSSNRVYDPENAHPS